MTVTWTGRRAIFRAAVSPANPAPTMTIRALYLPSIPSYRFGHGPLRRKLLALSTPPASTCDCPIHHSAGFVGLLRLHCSSHVDDLRSGRLAAEVSKSSFIFSSTFCPRHHLYFPLLVVARWDSVRSPAR